MTKYLPDSRIANMEDVSIISINKEKKDINNKQGKDPDEEPTKCKFFKDSKKGNEMRNIYKDLLEKSKLSDKKETNNINTIHNNDDNEDQLIFQKSINELNVTSKNSNPSEFINPNNKTIMAIGIKGKNELFAVQKKNVKKELELPNLTKIDKFERIEKRNSFSSKQRRDDDTQNRRSSNCPNLNRFGKPETSLDELYKIYNANDLYSKYVKANKKNIQILKELKNLELPEIISKEDSYSLNIKRPQKLLKEIGFERHLTSYSNEDQKAKQFIFGYKLHNQVANNNDQFISIPKSIPEEERLQYKFERDENILHDRVVITSNHKKKKAKKKFKMELGFKDNYNTVLQSGYPRKEPINEMEKERQKVDDLLGKDRKNKKDMENHWNNQKEKVDDKVNNNSRQKSPFREVNNLVSKLYPNLINTDNPRNSKCNTFKVIINTGNNSELVKKVFTLKYPDWKVSASNTNDFQLKWEMWSRNLNFYSLSLNQTQLVNHYESNQAISTKDKLFLNLAEYCDNIHINVFDLVPLTFVFDTSLREYSLLLEEFCQVHKCFSDAISLNQKNIISFINKRLLSFYTTKPRFGPKPKISHTQFDKNNLWILKPTGYNRGRGVSVFDDTYTLKRLINEICNGHCEEHPLNFYLNLNLNPKQKDNTNANIIETKEEKLGESERTEKQEKIEKIEKIEKLEKKEINDKIDKIDIIDKIDKIEKMNQIERLEKIEKLDRCVNLVKTRKFVIQKYIEKPLLFRGRKFDMRMWVLIDQEMRVYLFKEGYLRTSAKNFTLDHKNIPDKSIHLTNNAIQKCLKGYGEYEEGNQVSLYSFQEYLNEINSGIHFRECIYRQMKDLVEYSTKSVKFKLNPKDRHHQFEIFGYDFILDIDYKVWLIEVNTTPCLEESSGILKVLLPRMLNDTFNLTINKIFRIQRSENDTNQFPVNGYLDNENMWEYICNIAFKWNIKKSKKKKKIFYTHACSNSEDKYEPIKTYFDLKYQQNK